MKGVKKRSLESENQTSTTTSAPSLSENVNLFQSLRVLQEGENEDDRNSSQVCKYNIIASSSIFEVVVPMFDICQ